MTANYDAVLIGSGIGAIMSAKAACRSRRLPLLPERLDWLFARCRTPVGGDWFRRDVLRHRGRHDYVIFDVRSPDLGKLLPMEG